MRILLILLVSITFGESAFPQFLSNLTATKNDPLYTTYAAPMSRSSYKTDQAYELSWTDPEKGVEMISKDGLNFGVAFHSTNRTRTQLGQLYREPVITASYSDLVKLFYYPVRGIKIELFIAVYSSNYAIQEIKITNESEFTEEICLLPYCYYRSDDSINDFRHQSPFDLYTFPLEKKRDGWMKEHNIPLVEQLTGVVAGNMIPDSVTTFCIANGMKFPNTNSPAVILQKTIAGDNNSRKGVKGLMQYRTLRIHPGETTRFRLIYGLVEKTTRIPEISRSVVPLQHLDLTTILKGDEEAYSNIPGFFSHLNLPSLSRRLTEAEKRDLTLFSMSAFSLMRQCMMPPEGECRQNYYVFSREPKWGWGYGGQVFHESLAMMAYALMDPQGAMNSQRVYFDRQQPSGYINYRTGPYLNETIAYNQQLTSSAPWFNYENLEIFKITKDKGFLKEAYQSGLRFYNYFVANRDTNKNGLCEWGAEASLESVRDARVAVWDRIGWPANFEGPDINSMLVMEARSLAEMAGILGLPQEKRAWLDDAERRTKLINAYLWDEASSFYYNINKKTQKFTLNVTDDLKVKEIIGFLPLWAGVASQKQAKELVDKMTDPQEFWRPYGVPTLSATDSYYNPMGYWNGPVWVQWDYLLFKGLLDYGYKREAEELAFRVMDNMIYHLKKDHVFWEFYSPDDRQAGWNKTYIWAGIAARFLADLDALNR
jgi:hypothetical protein